ncbi:outer membrane beta-barrel protein [Zunongwangia sp. F363]|uniref:Outer membrane beta-barrel protein n=1 Tax=Autumnicola tepida TaxID=3075595 RepID=A0ABU3C828_9FLAO|nr:outer membrane beta-barrel protein [Zunongwangia sp. F363]MDT0642491.1 outer membrane beta-barrel protein [Zunongwangia sp. F363]
MIKYFLFVLFASVTLSNLQAQEYSFGLKAGINRAMGGELTGIPNGGFNGDTFQAESNIGFHGGAFFEIRFGKFLVRPEAIYNTIETEFDFPTRPSVYAVDKLSIPLLIGYNIFGPVDVYAGPAYTNIINATLQGNELNNSEVVAQNSPLSAHLGVKAGFGRFEIDFRYDRTLSSEQNQDVDIVNSQFGVNRANFTDSRLNQILLSLSFKLFDSEANPGRRSGRGCYF